MKTPIETKPALWGAAAGAAAMAIIGFTWGGWVTGSKAETTAQMQSDNAVVMALAPVCAERFQRAGEAKANLAELKKADSWSQGDYVEKGGWATVAGSSEPHRVSAVAKACAELLAGAEPMPK
jgi:hypothetical protein